MARIGEATKPDGTVEQIGHILVNWVSKSSHITSSAAACDVTQSSLVIPPESKNKTLNSNKVVVIRVYNLVKNTELDCVTDLLTNNIPD